MIAHVSAAHGVAVLSLPALGPVAVRRRTVGAIVRLAGHLLGDTGQAAGGGGRRRPLARVVRRRMLELGRRVELEEHGMGLVARVVTGNIWLLLGMLRANRPWRLAVRLVRAMVAAVAVGVFALVTSDVWRLAGYLGTLRLTIIGLGSVAATSVTIMIATGLWERSPHPSAREQVILFNIVTAVTVGIGVAVLYGAIFLAMLAAALLLVPVGLLGGALGHPAAWPTRCSWPGWPPRSPRWAARSAPRWKPARPCAMRPTPTARILSWNRRVRPERAIRSEDRGEVSPPRQAGAFPNGELHRRGELLGDGRVQGIVRNARLHPARPTKPAPLPCLIPDQILARRACSRPTNPDRTGRDQQYCP